MKPILLGALLALFAQFPTLLAVLLGVLGTVAVAAASSPAVWAFAAGLWAWPRITRRASRLVRSLT